jgi:hypothetical protein
MITVIGIFDNAELAELASSYLLANQFTNENVDLYNSVTQVHEQDPVGDFFNHVFEDEQQAAHYATLGRQGSVVTVHALSPREAQEAADALNNYGATGVNATVEDADGTGSRVQVIERVVDSSKRLR